MTLSYTLDRSTGMLCIEAWSRSSHRVVYWGPVKGMP